MADRIVIEDNTLTLENTASRLRVVASRYGDGNIELTLSDGGNAVRLGLTKREVSALRDFIRE